MRLTLDRSSEPATGTEPSTVEFAAAYLDQTETPIVHLSREDDAALGSPYRIAVTIAQPGHITPEPPTDRATKEAVWDEAVGMVCAMAGLRNVNWPNPYRQTTHTEETTQ